MYNKLVSVTLSSLFPDSRLPASGFTSPTVIRTYTEHGINGIHLTETGSPHVNEYAETRHGPNRHYRVGEWVYFPNEGVQVFLKKYAQYHASDTEGLRLLKEAMPGIQQAFIDQNRTHTFIHALRLAVTLSELGQKAPDILAVILAELVINSPLASDEAVELLQQGSTTLSRQDIFMIRVLIDRQEKLHTTCTAFFRLRENHGIITLGHTLTTGDKQEVFRFLARNALSLSCLRGRQNASQEDYARSAFLLLAEGCRYYNSLLASDFHEMLAKEDSTPTDNCTRWALEQIWEELFAHVLGLKDFSYRIRQTLFDLDHDAVMINALRKQVVGKLQSVLTAECVTKMITHESFGSYGFPTVFPIDSEMRVRGFLTRFSRYIEDTMRSHGLEVKVQFRVKNLFSIVQKLEKISEAQEIMNLPADTFSQFVSDKIGHVEDLLALRIITQSEEDCYTAFEVLRQSGLVHPEKGKKDFIESPKKNGYKTLHAKQYTQDATGKESAVYEVQIRTEKDHINAEIGEASHFAYKNGSDGSRALSGISLLHFDDITPAQVIRLFIRQFEGQFPDNLIDFPVPSNQSTQSTGQKDSTTAIQGGAG